MHATYLSRVKNGHKNMPFPPFGLVRCDPFRKN